MVALSSSESEYYALVKASSEGLGIRSAAKDWGKEVVVEVHVDSNGAKGHCREAGFE